jgi:hypothetical protein
MAYPTLAQVNADILSLQTKDDPRQQEALLELIQWYIDLPYPGIDVYNEPDNVYVPTRDAELKILFLIHNELRMHTHSEIFQNLVPDFHPAFEDYLAPKEPEEANDDRPINRPRHILESWGLGEMMIRQAAVDEIAAQKAERNAGTTT